MNLSLLRSFCAVAETQHLGRAAMALHVSASPLSRQIRALEDELGLALFVRERQRLRLTEAGRWLLGEARQLLDHAGRLDRDVRDRASGRAGSVSVGFVSAAMWSDVLPNALTAFGHAHPRVRVALRSLASRDQVEAVRAGHLDLGFVHVVRDETGLLVQQVGVENLALVIPRSHALARRRPVLPKDLDGQRWIALGRDLAPGPFDEWRVFAAAHGFQVDVVCEASNPATVLRLVECGLGMAVLPTGARRLASGAVVFRKVPWLPHTASLLLVSRSDGRPPLVDRFAATVTRIAPRRPPPDDSATNAL